MDDVLEFLKAANTYFLATEDREQPQNRPFGSICKFEDRLYVCTNNTKSVYEQMLANPRVSICGMANGKWIRVDAQVVPDHRREAKAAMLDEYGDELRRMYSLDDGIFEVLWLKDARATIYSFTAEPVVIEF